MRKGWEIWNAAFASHNIRRRLWWVSTMSRSRDFEGRLQSLDETPLLHADLGSVELLQSIDTGTRDVGVQNVLLFELTTIHRLVGTLDLDGDGGLTLLADGDGLVVTLN